MREDEVKRLLGDWLQSTGWTVQIAFGRSPGIDLDASRGDERWVIEAKGITAEPTLDFHTMLGQIIFQMHDPLIRYSVALPEGDTYRLRWNRLPDLAKQRLGLTALFVAADGTVTEAS